VGAFDRIEYHLGVDGLGALMLVLSAIVTLMSGGRGASCASSAGALLRAGAAAGVRALRTFTALNFFHWFLFWELSLIPAFFPDQALGRGKARPGGYAVLVYTMVGSVALLVAMLAVYLSTGSMDFQRLTLLASTGELEQMVVNHLGAVVLGGPVMMWLAAGALLGFAVKVPLFPFHTWLPAAYAEAPSPVTMLLTGAMSKMGVYGLLRIAVPLFGPQIAEMRTPLLVLAVATVVMGAWAAVQQKDLKRVFAYSSVESPRLLFCRHLCSCRAGRRRRCGRSSKPVRCVERGHFADVQSRPYGCRAFLVCRDLADAHRRPSRHRPVWRRAQACACGLPG